MVNAQISEDYSKVRVNSLKTFIESIAPNRTIILEVDELYLNEDEVNMLEETEYISLEGLGSTKKNKIITIKNVKNVTIIGKPKNLDKTKITSPLGNGMVLKFRNSENINLSNLNLGHSKPVCSAGVIGFYDSKNIKMNNIDLYGSGFFGFELKNVSFFTFNNSTIHDCSEYACSITDSNNIVFQSSKIRNLPAAWGGAINIKNSNDILFNDNLIFNIEGGGSVFYFEGVKNIKIENNLFKNIQSKYFANDNSVFALKNNRFKSNKFIVPKSISLEKKDLINALKEYKKNLPDGEYEIPKQGRLPYYNADANLQKDKDIIIELIHVFAPISRLGSDSTRWIDESLLLALDKIKNDDSLIKDNNVIEAVKFLSKHSYWSRHPQVIALKNNRFKSNKFIVPKSVSLEKKGLINALKEYKKNLPDGEYEIPKQGRLPYYNADANLQKDKDIIIELIHVFAPISRLGSDSTRWIDESLLLALDKIKNDDSLIKDNNVIEAVKFLSKHSYWSEHPQVIKLMNQEIKEYYWNYNKAGAKVKEGLGGWSPFKHSIPYGEKVKSVKVLDSQTIDNFEGNWREIKFQEKKGYIFDGYFSKYPFSDGLNIEGFYKRLKELNLNITYDNQSISRGGITSLNSKIIFNDCSINDAFWVFKNWVDSHYLDRIYHTSFITFPEISGDMEITINNPEKMKHIWTEDYKITLDDTLTPSLFVYSSRQEGGGSYVRMKKLSERQWELSETQVAD